MQISTDDRNIIKVPTFNNVRIFASSRTSTILLEKDNKILIPVPKLEDSTDREDLELVIVNGVMKQFPVLEVEITSSVNAKIQYVGGFLHGSERYLVPKDTIGFGFCKSIRFLSSSKEWSFELCIPFLK